MSRLAPPPDGMIAALLTAGLRLAEALEAENAALAALDLPRAAGLAETKIRASDAFSAAREAAAKTGAKADGQARQLVEGLASQLQVLGTENRRLLERAVSIQSRVIETIAGAMLPRQAALGGAYGAAGRRAQPRQAAPLAMQTRA